MADEIKIQVTGDSSGLTASMQQAADSVQKFVTSTTPVVPALNTSKEAGDVFAASLAQLNNTISSFQSGLEAIPTKLEAISSSLHHAAESGGELPNLFHKIETSAEMREASQSIREAIENPLAAAKKAAEGFLLSFGEAGLVATGISALSGVLLESANHVGELAHEYEKLSGMLGIGIEPAEHLARTFALMGLDQGALVMASRGLSRVLDDGSEQARRTRAEVQALGVSFADSATGGLKSFDELLPEIITHLQGMVDVTARNHLATELFGRAALQLLGLDWNKFSKLAEGGLSGKAIEDAAAYDLVWKSIKQTIGDSTNALGAFIASSVIAKMPEPERTGLETKKPDAAEKALNAGKESGAALTAGFESTIKIDTGAIAAQASVEKLKKSLGGAAEYEAVQSANRGIAASLVNLGGAAEAAEKKFTSLQGELGKYANKNLPLSAPITPVAEAPGAANIGQLKEAVDAARGVAESYKAAAEYQKIEKEQIEATAASQLAALNQESKAAEDSLKLAKETAEEKLKLGIQSVTQEETLRVTTVSGAAARPLESGEDPRLAMEEEYQNTLARLADQELVTSRSVAEQKRIITVSEINQEIGEQQKIANSSAQPLEKRAAAEAEIVALANKRAKAYEDADAAIQSADARWESAALAAIAAVSEAQQKEATRWVAIQEDAAENATKIAEQQATETAAKALQISEATSAAENKKRQDAVETEIKQLQSIEAVRLAEMEGAGVGFKQRIALAEAYGARITEAIGRLNALKEAEAAARDAQANTKTEKEATFAPGVGGIPNVPAIPLQPLPSPPGVTPGAGGALTGPAGLSQTQGPNVGTLESSAAATNALAAATLAAAQAQDTLNQKIAGMKKAQDEADFKKYFGQINSEMQSAISGWISGRQTFTQAFTKLGEQMVTSFITNLAMMAIKWVEHHVLLQAVQAAWNSISVALHISKNAADTAVDASGQAAQGAVNELAVTGQAAVAAAGAMASTAAIPVVGPEAAPAAGAAMFSAVMGYASLASAEKGAVIGGAPTLALLHPNEMVLPSHISQTVQTLASGSSGGASSGSGDTHNHYNSNVHYHAAPGDNPESIRKNSSEILSIVRKGLRNGKLVPA